MIVSLADFDVALLAEFGVRDEIRCVDKGRGANVAEETHLRWAAGSHEILAARQ